LSSERHEPQQRFDVAVIGAGPVGSFAAERMARAGLRVGLFEKDPVPGASTVCGGGVAIDVTRFIALPDEVVERWLTTSRLVSPSGRREWKFDHPQYVTVTRKALDRYLAERAAAAGATLKTCAKVISVTQAGGDIVYLDTATHTQHRVVAGVVMFADGPNSLAYRTWSMGSPKEIPRWIGVEVDLETAPGDFDALEIALDKRSLPFGYYWIFPKRDHVNVGLIRWAGIEGPNLQGLLDEFIASRPDLCGRTALRRYGGVIPAAAAPRLQSGNGVAVGDAAGMVNPLTGGGYICGFLSASIAADTCIEAFAGGLLRPEVLSHYPVRLRRTMHYRSIRAAGALLKGIASIQRNTNLALYPAFFSWYFRSAHLALRFAHALPKRSAQRALDE
jgi:digeranylgeranylglycerophospholipid reductase